MIENTLYWADTYLWQAEIWLHNAKHKRNKENNLRVAEIWTNKCREILKNGWKDNPLIVYSMESHKPKYMPDLEHFGLHEFKIEKYHKTSHKRKPKELKPQPQCQCVHFNYEHKNGSCTKCDCMKFKLK